MAVISSDVCTDSGGVNNAGERIQSKWIHGRRQKQCAFELHEWRSAKKSAQGDTVKGLKKLTENRDWQKNWKMKKGDGDFKRGKEEQNRDIKERS